MTTNEKIEQLKTMNNSVDSAIIVVIDEAGEEIKEEFREAFDMGMNMADQGFAEKNIAWYSKKKSYPVKYGHYRTLNITGEFRKNLNISKGKIQSLAEHGKQVFNKIKSIGNVNIFKINISNYPELKQKLTSNLIKKLNNE